MKVVRKLSISKNKSFNYQTLKDILKVFPNAVEFTIKEMPKIALKEALSLIMNKYTILFITPCFPSI